MDIWGINQQVEDFFLSDPLFAVSYLWNNSVLEREREREKKSESVCVKQSRGLVSYNITTCQK